MCRLTQKLVDVAHTSPPHITPAHTQPTTPHVLATTSRHTCSTTDSRRPRGSMHRKAFSNHTSLSYVFESQTPQTTSHHAAPCSTDGMFLMSSSTCPPSQPVDASKTCDLRSYSANTLRWQPERPSPEQRCLQVDSNATLDKHASACVYCAIRAEKLLHKSTHRQTC